MENNGIAYVVVFIQGFLMQKIYAIECHTREEARGVFKSLDEIKNKMDAVRQERFNIHIWGKYEIDMLKTEVKNIDFTLDLNIIEAQILKLLH